MLNSTDISTATSFSNSRPLKPFAAVELSNTAKMFKKTLDFCVFKSTLPKLKLYDLNDDCLAHIFQMLDIQDLHAVGCTSPRFENVFHLFNRKFEYSVLNVSDPNLIHFLQVVGTHIKYMNVTINDRNDSATVQAFLDAVQTYCTNLKHLLIKKWRQLNFEKFDVLIKRLESLRLEECKYPEKIEMLNRRFVIKPWIMAPPSFYSLSSSSMKSDCLANLTNITTLKLHQCTGIRPDHLAEFLEQNDRLSELSLFNLHEFKADTHDQQFFDGLTKYLQTIKFISIDMDTTNEIQFIAKLPHLRSLQLLNYSVYNDRVVDSLLRKLCESNGIEELDLYHCNLGRNTYRVISQFNQLSALKLCKNFWVTEQHLRLLDQMPKLRKFCCFDCILLSDEGLLSIVKMAPHLEQLDCSWCFQITNRTIHDILNLLRHQKHRPKLEILAGGRTKMTRSILETSSMNKNGDRLSIKFEPSMPITCILQDNFCTNCTTIKPSRTWT